MLYETVNIRFAYGARFLSDSIGPEFGEVVAKAP